jgi:ParB-like chromosome segregation protein Spo0J
MDIVTLPIEQLIPYARNPRRNDDAVATVAASLAEFGWRQPIVVDERMAIVVGHTRWAAAKRLGMTEVPVHVARGLTPAQIKAYRLMDNRSHENAEWDDALLKLELEDLKLEDLDLALTGFDDQEIAKLLADGMDDAAAEEAPEPPVDPISRPGDLWICGGHRVLCADATVLADVEKGLDGELADMCFTDSPYNVNYSNSEKDKLRGNIRPILNDNLGE